MNPLPSTTSLQKIQHAARLEFAKRGYNAAKLENIARSAGVSKQLIYHYFATKDQLYRQLLEEAGQSTSDNLGDDIYDGLGPEETICKIIERTIEIFMKDPFISAVTLDEALHDGEHISRRSPFIPTLKRFIEERVRPALEEGEALGVFRPNVDPVLFYWAAFSIATAPLLNTHVISEICGERVDTKENMERWRAHAVEFILLSLRPL